MVLGKIYRVSHKIDKESVCSILLEHRHEKTALLFEAEALAVLCKCRPRAERRRPPFEFIAVTPTISVICVMRLAIVCAH